MEHLELTAGVDMEAWSREAVVPLRDHFDNVLSHSFDPEWLEDAYRFFETRGRIRVYYDSRVGPVSSMGVSFE